jgi:hypothetical protein
MPTLLVRNAAVLMTMDDQRRGISGGLFRRDGFIEQVALPVSSQTQDRSI